MTLDILTVVPSFLYYLWVKYQENKIGYKLVLPEFNHNWINGTFIFDMAPVWKKYGQSAIGVNYFTIGAVDKGTSSRYDPKSDYYQSWLGGYVVKFPYARNWTLPEHYQLGESDQKNWLDMMGDPHPIIDAFSKDIKITDTTKISGFPSKVIRAGAWSHSDLGSGMPRFALNLLMSGMANIFKFSNSKLSLGGGNLLPHWSDKFNIKPYEKLYLTGYFIIVDITPQIKAILYGNGTKKTLPRIQDELLSLMQSFHIEKT